VLASAPVCFSTVFVGSIQPLLSPSFGFVFRRAHCGYVPSFDLGTRLTLPLCWLQLLFASALSLSARFSRGFCLISELAFVVPIAITCRLLTSAFYSASLLACITSLRSTFLFAFVFGFSSVCFSTVFVGSFQPWLLPNF
jgi:hypothetical protein